MITPNINRSVPVIGVIKSIKKALKASMKDPFLYTEEEIHKLKKQNVTMKKLNQTQERNKKVDLDNLPLYDCIQEQEDDWVSSVLGSETDALNDLF